MVDDLREQLLSVMDRKNHWAWPHFTRPGLTKVQLAIHFRHEYHTYVRDFPALLARVLGQGPPDDVRSALAALERVLAQLVVRGERVRPQEVAGLMLQRHEPRRIARPVRNIDFGHRRSLPPETDRQTCYSMRSTISA